MSDNQVTDKLADYRSGRIDWPTCRDWLTHHTYVNPQRYEDGSTVKNTVALRDWDTIHVPGSWDDVRRAWAIGELTDAEYLEVVGAVNAAAGRN